MPADLQSAPVGHLGTPPTLTSSMPFLSTGPPTEAGGGIRTRDLLLTRQLLYQLSYASIPRTVRAQIRTALEVWGTAGSSALGRACQACAHAVKPRPVDYLAAAS